MKSEKVLKARQINAIKLLAIGTPAAKIAETLDVSVMTLWRWRRIPEFEARLSSITSSGLEEIAQKMNAAALTAVENIQLALCDMTLPTATQLKLSLGVLNAMPAMNAALEKGLRHRVADFDAQARWNGQLCGHGHTYDIADESCTSIEV